jgi:hypothetical protein
MASPQPKKGNPNVLTPVVLIEPVADGFLGRSSKRFLQDCVVVVTAIGLERRQPKI